MRWRIIFGFVFFLIVFLLLAVYWFVPLNDVEFGVKPENNNFSIGVLEDIQFYPNMRFPNSEISYKIYDCPLQKKNDMERAFDIISNESLVSFYSVGDSEDISVNCESRSKMEEGLFIAGEGGPTNITRAGKFNVILHGSILLLRDSKCDKPNVAIHELLHTLGFNHSVNSDNIMYPISKCGQTIGEDILELINELYSLPSYPDLDIEDVSAIMHGRYLDTNISVKNNGFMKSKESNILIYADGELVEDIGLDGLDIGYGKKIVLGNLFVSKRDVEELEFVIDYGFEELEKNNNRISLEIKNKN